MAGLDQEELGTEPLAAEPEVEQQDDGGEGGEPAPAPSRFEKLEPVFDVHKAWADRQRRRDELRTELETERQERARVAAENAAFRKMYGELLAEGDQKAEPDFETQGPEWFQHKLAENRRQMEERLAPVLGMAEQYARQQQEQQQMAAQQAEFSRREEAVRSVMAEAETAYEATESGAGFKNRMPFYVNQIEQHYIGQGYTPEQAVQKRIQTIGGLLAEAQADGRNWAAHVDYNLWSHFGEPPAHMLAQEPQRQPAPLPRSVVQTQRLAASGLTNSLSGTPQGSQGRVEGGPTVAEMKEAAKQARRAGARGPISEMVGDLTRPRRGE